MNWGLSIVFRGFNTVFDKITGGYGWTIGHSLRIALLMLLLYGGLLYATYWSMGHAPTGFIPEQDQGYLLVNVQLPDSASLERTQQVMGVVDKIALGDPDDKQNYPGIPGVDHTLSVSGQSILLSANGSNFGSTFVILKPFDKRHSHEEYDAVIAEKLRRKFGQQIDDAVITVFRAPPIQGLGNAGGFQLQVEQRGFVDLDELQSATDELVRDANTDPLHRLIGVFSMFRADTPQLYVDIDRTKCESLMVPVSDVFNALQTYMGGYYVNLFNLFGRTWQVNLQAQGEFRTQGSSVGQLKVRNKLGQMVPLATLATVKSVGGPVMYMRYNMYPSAAVNGNPAPGVSSGQAIQLMENKCDELNLPYEWTTITYMQIQAGNVGLFVFGLGSMLVFLVLAAKYESWKLPLSVILVVPMCLLCSVVGMLIARHAGRYFRADRLSGAGRHGGEERDSDCRVRPATARAGPRSARRRRRSLPFAIAADRDDQLRLHPGRGAIDARPRRRRRNARVAGHRRVLRHDRRDDIRHFPDAGVLLRDYVPPGALRGCGPQKGGC